MTRLPDPTRRPVVSRALCLRRGVQLAAAGDGVELRLDGRRQLVRPLPAPVVETLEALVGRSLGSSELRERLGPGGERVLSAVVARVGRYLSYAVSAGDRLLLRVEPGGTDGRLASQPLADDAVVRLSRFALLRRVDDTLILECPLTTTRFVIIDAEVAVLAAHLAHPTAVARLDAIGTWARSVTELLVGAGTAEVSGPEGTFAADADPALRTWEFHDALMHSSTRSGRSPEARGATYPFRGTAEPVSPWARVPTGPVTALPTLDLGEVSAGDPSLTEALETRRTERRHGSRPLDLDELAEFLYRTSRTTAHYRSADPDEDERISRPYPSGGAAYELEVYVTVRRCHGLAAGVYCYDAREHALVLLTDEPVAVGEMFAASIGVGGPSSVLVSLVSRHPRIAWKYEGIAYALTLRHTGVVVQTMYLVATAMGLAACALGLGDAETTSRICRLSGSETVPVGEFVLGSRDAGVAGTPPDLTGWTLLHPADPSSGRA